MISYEMAKIDAKIVVDAVDIASRHRDGVGTVRSVMVAGNLGDCNRERSKIGSIRPSAPAGRG
jgi:hypothetical protein